MRWLGLWVLFFLGWGSVGRGNGVWVFDEEFLHAVRLGEVEEVREMAGRMELDQKGHMGWTVLMHALDARQVEVARVLMEAGAEVNVKADDVKLHEFPRLDEGISALGLACRTGDAELVKLMLEKGADPEFYR